MTMYHPRRIFLRRCWIVLVLQLCLACFVSTTLAATFRFKTGSSSSSSSHFQLPKENPYTVLGIPLHLRHDTDAIKKAYRELAKKSHPDKNPDIDPKVANERFHRINAAYEYLSNKEQKLFYDKSMNRNAQRNNNNNNKNSRNNYHQNSRQSQQEILRRKEQERKRRHEEAEKRKKEQALAKMAKVAQKSMPKISTLDDLMDLGIVDPTTKIFTKHFLCVFVHNKKVESEAQDQYLFPYPFGGSSSSGGDSSSFDWTTVLQTAKIRYNKSTLLTTYFKIPLKSLKPTFVFVPAGSSLLELKPQVYNHGRINSREKFETWVLNQLKTTVTIVNKNPKPSPSLRVYYATKVNEGSASSSSSSSSPQWLLKSALRTVGKPIPPGYLLEIPAKISDRIVVLDETVNEFIGSYNSNNNHELRLEQDVLERVIMDSFVVTDENPTFRVGTGYGTTRTCYDMSFQCQNWLQAHPGRCETHATFAHSMCAKSCKVCTDYSSSFTAAHFNGLLYWTMHMPLYKVPDGIFRKIHMGIRHVANVVRMFVVDFVHCWQMRRTVTAGFCVAGLLFGIQIVLWAQMMMRMQGTVADSNHHRQQYCPVSLVRVGFWFFLTGVLASALLFVYHARPHEFVEFPTLVSLHFDLLNLWMYSKDVAVLFGCIGLGSLVACKVLTYPFLRRSSTLASRVVFLACLAIASYAMVIGITIHLHHERKYSPHMGILSQKWDRAIQYYKNVAAAFIVFGHLVGNTGLTFLWYLRYRVFGNFYIQATIVNFVVACGLVSSALRDRYFLQDLDHVASMRMTAAIPCLVAGVALGVTVGHQLFGRMRQQQQQPRDDPASTTKQKID